MNKISNTEKQVRYRKREGLKRRADNIFRKWQLEPWKWNSKTPQDVRHALDRAINLKSGWTERDYGHAESNLAQIEADLFLTSDQLANDVEAGWGPQVFMTTSDPAKL
ncbi:MAG: hypothetical protein KDK78_08990, partial [Chlamydiia bacterium]|nr:hypothetical protein [Chlamydiia bacterium]